LVKEASSGLAGDDDDEIDEDEDDDDDGEVVDEPCHDPRR
jgi:hypothetical protein